MAITINGGASGSQVTINADKQTDAAYDLAGQVVKQLADISNTTLVSEIVSGSDPATESNKINVGTIDQAGDYTVSSAYKYVVVGDKTEVTSATDARINLTGVGKIGDTVNVVAGHKAGTTYKAGQESGTFINTASTAIFDGTGDKTGSWNIQTGSADDMIVLTNGNNTVNAGLGNNNIYLGKGNNAVYSYGHDTISGGEGGYQSVTLFGGNSTVDVGTSSLVIDSSSKNTISVGGESTVVGGQNSTVKFMGGQGNSFMGGVNDTISAIKGNLTVVHGSENNITVDNTLTFLNGTGNNTVTAGNATVFGATGLNMNINVTKSSQDGSLFVAGGGNETLNGSASTGALHVFANNQAGTQLEAIGGSGDDTLVGGAGDSKFTGGAGNNLFAFIKNDAQTHNVITDFKASVGNKIGLYNYGLDANSLQNALQSAVDQAGNTTLSFGATSITLEGVKASDLSVANFDISNSNGSASS